MKRYESYKPSGISWIGEIPSHWEVRRNKYLFKEEDEKNLDLSFQLLTFSRKKGIIPFSDVNEKEPSASDLNNYKVIRQGQLLENRMQAWSGMFAKSEIDGCVSPDYSVFSPTSEDVCVDFFAHLFRTNQYIAHWANLSRGVGNGFNRLYTNQFHSVYALFPPIDEQKKIVEYLSTKTSLIDAQQRERERELRLLEELKQAEIANVVTRGLNPNVPMKKANTLLGKEIPISWKLVRNRNILREENTLVGNRKDLPLLSLTKSGIILRDVESGKGKFPKDFEKYKEVVPGNIVFCLFDIDETPRTVGLSSHRGMITGAYDVFSINNEIIDSRFLYHYFIAVDNIKALRPFYTGLRKVVQMASFLGIQIPIPPIEEQRAIVEYIEQKNNAIDEMIANLKAEIDFLTEYKQRLIADAVTGQIKID